MDLENLLSQVLAFIPDLIIALVILYAFRVVFRLSAPSLRAVLKRAQFEDAMITLFVDRVYAALLMIFAGLWAAGQVGINVGAAIAGLGVAGIALGFAAQDTLSNIIAGFMIFWDRPFTVGDYISVAGHYGSVRELTLRTTRIRTLNNTYIVIPNRTIIDEVLINNSQHGQMRLEIPVGIAYKESIAEAREVLVTAMTHVEGVMALPPPDVVVTELADSGVNLYVRVWIDDARDEKPVFFRAIEASKVALDEAGIEIPFPHRQLVADWPSMGTAMREQ